MKAMTRVSLFAVMVSCVVGLIPFTTYADPNQDLLNAVKNNGVEEIRSALEKGADVNSVDDRGKTALILAIENGKPKASLEIVKILLKYDAEVDDRVFLEAAKSNDEELMQLLVDKKMDEEFTFDKPEIPSNKELADRAIEQALKDTIEHSNNVKNDKVESIPADPTQALLKAAKDNNLEAIKMAIERGADLNSVDGRGKTVLMLVLESSNPSRRSQKVNDAPLEIVKFLLEQDVDVNATISSGETALLFALVLAEWDSVKLLIKYGANVNIEKKSSLVYLLESMSARLNIGWSIKNFINMLRFLLEKGADVNAVNETVFGDFQIFRAKKTTPLSAGMLFSSSHINVIKLLLEHGAKIDSSVLLEAINSNDAKLVQRFVDHGANIHELDDSVFVSVVERNNPELVQLFLDNGVNINATDINGQTALIAAARIAALQKAIGGMEVSLNIVKSILEKKPDIDAQDVSGKTALWSAAGGNAPILVKLLVEHGANLAIEDNYGRTAREQAHSRGRNDAIRMFDWLERRGEDPSEDLLVGILSQDINLVKLSLKNGAAANAEIDNRLFGSFPPLLSVNVNGNEFFGSYPPLIWAASVGDAEIVKFLLKSGVNADTEAIHYYDGERFTAMMVAEENDFEDVIRLLRKAGAQGSEEKGALLDQLLEAVGSGTLDDVKQAVEEGADINALCESDNFQGATALMVATGAGHLHIVEYLLEHGANPNIAIDVKGFSGGTALFLASAQGNAEIVKSLLQKGADANVKIQDGQLQGETPLSIAIQEDHSDVVLLLLEAGANSDELPDESLGLEKMRRIGTKRLMKTIGLALSSYHVDNETLPQSSEDIEVSQIGLPTEYYDGIYHDSWSNPIMYRSDGASYTLTSYGRDKEPGGEFFDADIIFQNFQFLGEDEFGTP